MKNSLFLILVVFSLFACNKSNDSADLANKEKIEAMVASSEKMTSYVSLTKEQVRALNGNNSDSVKSTLRDNNGGAGGGNALVIVCYGYGTPSEDCYGIWGTDDCADTDCPEECPGSNCCCVEVSG